MHPLMVLGGAAGVALALAIPLILPGRAHGQDSESQAPIIWFLPGAGERAVLRLPADGAAPRGAVIVLGDTPRVAAYPGRPMAALTAAGLAVLELPGDGRPRRADQLATSLEEARAALGAMPTLSGRRLGVLGFGTGAEVVLARAGLAEAAALGPICAALPDLAAPHAANAPLLLLAASQPVASAAGRAATRGALVATLPCFEVLAAREQAMPGVDPAEAVARVVWFLADLMVPQAATAGAD
jgi:hypothetical protein